MSNWNDRNVLVLIFVFTLGVMIGVALVHYTQPACRTQFLSYPSDESDVISLINSARDSVYVEMYVFTNEKIMEALADADKRGVDVRVILDKSVNINEDAYLYLKSQGVDVKWASAKYKLTHSKLMIVDDKVFIGSPNFSWNAFHKNREFAVILYCDTGANYYIRKFLEDWKIAG